MRNDRCVLTAWNYFARCTSFITTISTTTTTTTTTTTDNNNINGLVGWRVGGLVGWWVGGFLGWRAGGLVFDAAEKMVCQAAPNCSFLRLQSSEEKITKSSKCLTKSSPYSGPSAGAEVASFTEVARLVPSKHALGATQRDPTPRNRIR